MSHRDHDRAFGDAVYDAWMAGLDVDAVDHDRIDDRLYDGAYPDEAAAAEVDYLRVLDRVRREDAADPEDEP